MLVRIYDYPAGADFDRVVECTEAEWRQLTASARANRQPIDGATVDETLLDLLMDRPAQSGKATRRIPLV